MEPVKTIRDSRGPQRMAALSVAVRVVIGAVLLLAGLVTLFFAPFFLFASDACPDPSRRVCTEPGQTLVVLLPAIGSPAMMIGGTIGLCHRRYGPVWGLLALCGLYAVWTVNSYLIG